MIRLRVRFLSGTQKVFLREELESMRIKKNNDLVTTLVIFVIGGVIISKDI